MNTTSLSTNLNGIGSDLSTSLIKNVNDIKKKTYCTVVADSYADLTTQLWGYLTPEFLMIVLFLFLMHIFLFPVIVCLIILAKRLRHKYNGDYVGETKFK